MSLTYDKAGRKLTMSDPDMGFWQYSYDALGNMKTQLDARGCTLTLTYDELNRPDTKTSSGNCGKQISVDYNYDEGTNGKGRRTSMSDGSGSTSWLYDSRGRMWKETKVISGASFDTEWTYNSADLPKTMKYPDGEIVTTTYDNNMLPKTTIGNATYVSNTNYDSAGRMTSRALGNGLTQNYHYYDWNEQVNNIGQGGRLETLVTGFLQNLSYVYDQVGNISQITNSVASETNTYGYDALDRLTGWTLNSVTETYAYSDSSGNLINKNGLVLAYPAANGSNPTHPHAVTSANGNTYAYDANGNQTTRNIGPDTFTLLYDAENRLVEVKKNNVTTAQFTFDGDGKRVKSVIGSETILFAGGHYEKKGSTITKYYFAGASRVAMRKYTIPQNMTVEYMLGDHLGSTSITTDNAGVKVSEMRYKPWGELRYSWTDSNLNTTPTYELTKYQFTGQYSYTTEFGLMFYGARWLDTTTGRFVQADTVVPPGVQGYDRYAYTRNNPVRYIDPSGHQEVSPCSEAAGGCNITEQVEAEDQADAEYFRQRTNALRCQSGETTYCSYGEQHPVEVFLFAVGGMAGATAIEAFILEGGAAVISEVAYWRAVLSCLRSAICRTITGMAGGAGSKLSSYQIGQNGVKQVLETLDDPSAQTEQTLTANGLSGRFDIATDTTLNEVKNVANLSLSQRFMEQAMRYSTIAEGLGKPLHYWLVNDKPQYIVDWLQNLGITVH